MTYIHLIFLVFTSLFQTSPSFNSYSSTLRPGEALEFDGKAIRFKEIISDSRCPTGVTCVWAGEAKVLVGIYEGGEMCGDKIMTISAGGEVLSLQQLFPEEVVQLLPPILTPYPEIKRVIEPQEYSLSLEVRVEREEN